MFSLFGHYLSRLHFAIGVLELVGFYFSLYLGFYTRFGRIWVENDSLNYTELSITAIIFAVLLLVAMISLGLYRRGLTAGATLIVRIIVALGLGSVGIALVFYILPDLHLGRGVFAYAIFYSFASTLIIRSLFFHFASEDSFAHNTLVLGCGESAALVRDFAKSQPGVCVHGFIKASGSEQSDSNINAITDAITIEQPLLDYALTNDVDEIVVAVDDRRKKIPLNELLDCKLRGLRVLDMTSFFEKEGSCINLRYLNPSWIINSSGFYMGPFTRFFKRSMDLLVASLMLLVVSPIMLLVTLASLIESRGKAPVFFHQTRTGEHGKAFSVHKFRSMIPEAESDGVARWATENDERVTILGKFIRKTRIDELPQLFNVLNGEMSLVGPRPERPEFIVEFSKNIPFYNERHSVKPGVTGWAQLRYQYGASEEDAKNKLEYDLYYVKNASVFLDFIILLETVEVVLWGKGAR